VARAVAAAIVVSLLAVSGAGGAGTQTPKRGGTVVISWGTRWGCLNYFNVACGVGPVTGWLNDVFAGAFEQTPGLRYRSGLVSHVDVRKEPFTLTYHLRPEARWSDGVPVTASDFVFTYRAFRKYLPPDFPENLDLRKVRRVRALDAKTVRVEFTSRFGGWRDLFFVVFPRHALAGEDLRGIWKDRIENPKTGEPIGSGPFLLTSREVDRQVTLVRNPRYWGPHQAYLDRVVWRRVDGDPFEGLERGEIDLASLLGPSVNTILELRRQPGIRVVSVAATAWEHFAIRVGAGGHPALKNKIVRRALAYGVDRETIVRELYGQIDPKLRPSDSAIFVTSSPFYRPHWSSYRYRPVQARRLLEQAGCSKGDDGVYVCADERLSLRFVTTAGNTNRELAVRLAQAQLRKVGVEVKTTFATTAAFFDQILPDGDFDLALFRFLMLPSGSSSIDIYRCGGPRNYTGYCQRLVTSELVQTELIVDEEQRARVLNAADRKLARDVPVIPLFQVPAVTAYKAALRNVVPHPRPEAQSWNAEDWWLER